MGINYGKRTDNSKWSPKFKSELENLKNIQRPKIVAAMAEASW